MPETLAETAALVTRRGNACGGRGIAVHVDHTQDTQDAQVETLFARIQAEHGHLDLLVNTVWGRVREHEAVRPPLLGQALIYATMSRPMVRRLA